MLDGLVILPGALDLLAALADRGLAQAIFTNKHGPTAREVSRHAGFDAYAPLCVGHTDTTWQKPDPQLTRHVLHELGASPETTVLVGDSPTDADTARAAGLPCYGVATGAHTTDELLAAGAAAAFAGLPGLRTAWGL
jgi:phosphoglycolate phosphatase